MGSQRLNHRVPQRNLRAFDFLFRYNALVERVFSLISPLLTLLFAIGMTGCLLVIPMVAFKLFRVLFEDDSEDEPGKALVPRA